MTRPRILRLLAASLVCAGFACGTDTETADPPATAGAATVVGPDGTRTEVPPANPEPIDALAARFSDRGARVDLGEAFARPAIADEAGQRLVVDGDLLETWTFADEHRARAFAERFSTDGRLFDGERLPWTETTHVWTSGPMVVMYLGDEPHILAAVDAVGVRTTSHVDTETPAVAMEPAEVEARVRDSALARFDLDGQTPLTLVARERVVFDDACLEVEDVAEVCAEVETPGWRLVFAHGDDRLVAHTDIAASRIFWRSES